MARRKQSGFETVASVPWPVGIALGLLGYVAVRHGVGWYLHASDNPYLSGVGKAASTGLYAPLAWLLLIGCWAAAIASFVSRARRRRLLDSQTGIESLRQMSWREFEQLAGEAFRRQGYTVEETGLGGADGGNDLVLRKDGQTTLVQCKQWKTQHVGVSVVREMYGLLVHHQAAAVKIVALGDYTRDARQFARGKPIELIHGGELLATVHALQSANATRPVDTPLALVGSMLASLLAIAVFSPSAKVAAPISVQATHPTPASAPRAFLPKPVRVHRVTQPSAARPGPVIYASDPQDDAQLREWKKRNAASMKILEKTTKEVPLR